MSTNRFSDDSGQSPTPKRDALNAAADDNYLPEWNDGLTKLGLTAVAIQLTRCQQAFENAGAVERFGDGLKSAGLGHFDSVTFEPYIRFFFYVATPRLAEALQFFKASLEKLGLVDIAGISHADTTGRLWRVFWSGVTKP